MKDTREELVERRVAKCGRRALEQQDAESDDEEQQWHRWRNAGRSGDARLLKAHLHCRRGVRSFRRAIQRYASSGRAPNESSTGPAKSQRSFKPDQLRCPNATLSPVGSHL